MRVLSLSDYGKKCMALTGLVKSSGRDKDCMHSHIKRDGDREQKVEKEKDKLFDCLID